MKPDGDFVRQINRCQPGQPGPGTSWFVISSEFEPRRVQRRQTLRELPALLVKKLADGFADQLFGAPKRLWLSIRSR